MSCSQFEPAGVGIAQGSHGLFSRSSTNDKHPAGHESKLFPANAAIGLASKLYNTHTIGALEFEISLLWAQGRGMGRKSRLKPNAPALAARKKATPADDYFRKGPIELARFGKVVMMRNNMTPEQHQAWLKAIADRLPEVIATIDTHIAAIVKIVTSHNPLSLLQRGYWESIMPHILDDGKGETKESVVGQRMVDYIQSVIAAAPPGPGADMEVPDELWAEITKHVEGLFDTINRGYLESRKASWRVYGGGPPEDQEEFMFRALGMWCNVTGDRYHHQEIEYLRELLAPHSAVLQRLWGIDANGLVDGLGRILHALSRGVGEAFEQMHEAPQAFIKATETVEGEEAQAALLAETMSRLQTDQKTQRAANNIFGLGLFKIDDLLPHHLLRDLSWAPGECTTFMDSGSQSGWPTRIWPRSQRPFITVDGSYYCFDVHTLFDHFYRVLQRLVQTREPAYQQAWNDGQARASEDFPLKMFLKLLPGAKVWSSIHYQVKKLDMHGNKRWCEVDGLVVFEDHLFVVEVKAGAFTAAPPEQNLEFYLNSIEKLIFKPAEQGERLLRTLTEEGKVELCDKQHRKLGELFDKDFAHKTVCAMSLDPFTELSAKAYHLRKLAGRTDLAPFWALSIGDLMTYTELFNNPLVFLHFVEKRTQATRSSKVVLDDELDHYGMYLQHNNYDLHAEDMGTEGRMAWTGYRQVVDTYIHGKIRGEQVTLPRQNIPASYYAIIEQLNEGTHRERRKVASLLLDADGTVRSSVTKSLEEALASQAKSRRPKPLSIAGPAHRITFACGQAGVTFPGVFNALNHTKASMLVAGEKDRWLIELFYTEDGTLRKVEPTFIALAEMPVAERGALAPQVELLRTQRIEQKTAIAGKVGRNDLCPCGSGIKYKRCCLARRGGLTGRCKDVRS